MRTKKRSERCPQAIPVNEMQVSALMFAIWRDRAVHDVLRAKKKRTDVSLLHKFAGMLAPAVPSRDTNVRLRRLLSRPRCLTRVRHDGFVTVWCFHCGHALSSS